MTAANPLEAFLQQALTDFRAALVSQNVYDRDHQNLDRAFNGAKDFVSFLVAGSAALHPRPPRK